MPHQNQGMMTCFSSTTFGCFNSFTGGWDCHLFPWLFRNPRVLHDLQLSIFVSLVLEDLNAPTHCGMENWPRTSGMILTSEAVNRGDVHKQYDLTQPVTFLMAT